MMQEVVEFCKSYLAVNREAFCDPRLELVINDARFYFSYTINECFEIRPTGRFSIFMVEPVNCSGFQNNAVVTRS